MLRNHEIAQIALRDTLVVAEAHIARLADPELLGPWLYSLARAECCRRRAVQPSLADEPPARPSQHDADNRLMAWNAVMNMATDDLEALDLTCRHDVDLALVLGISAEDAQALLSQARQNLERALGAEMLIAKGSDACPERADILDGWGSGTVTPPIRERLMRHAEGCLVCEPQLPRNVSAARVFAQLPPPELSPLVRAQVLGLFANPKLLAYREFAVNWASALGESGFPVTSEPPASERARSAAETAAALADLSTDALPVFRPAASGLSGGNLSAAGAPSTSLPEVDVPAPVRPMADMATARRAAADAPAADLLSADALNADALSADALNASLAAAEWPTADLPAVDVPVAEMPAVSRPMADVPAARRPVADVPVVDRAAMSAPVASSRMASPEVASPAELWFASAKPTPVPARPEPVPARPEPVPARRAPVTSAAPRLAAPGSAAPKAAAARNVAAKSAVPKPVAPPKPAPGRAAARNPAATRTAGDSRLRVRRRRAILAGVGTMAAAAAIVSSFVLSGSTGKLVAAGGATSAGRTTSPSGLSASSAPILERQSGAPTTGTARASSKTPQSRPASLPSSAPANGDKGQVLIAGATQPLTTISVPRLGTPPQPVAPTSAVASSPAPTQSAAAGTLAISSGSVDLGTGSTSQVTLTAVSGSVSWSASTSSEQVSLTSYQGTLQAGQSVALYIAVNRGAQGGAAVIWIEPSAAPPTAVQVTWESFPGSGHGRHHGQNQPTADPSPSAPLPPGA